MSTFADANLQTMTLTQLQQYDIFLDENDWDIYYWATQDSADAAPAKGDEVQAKDEWKRSPASGEWAQTVGTFKPAYRPVPQRWKGSEILSLLRKHVKDRSAGGVTESNAKVAQTVKSTGGGGLGFMPEIRNFDQ
jgi:hypothetical protein